MAVAAAGTGALQFEGPKGILQFARVSSGSQRHFVTLRDSQLSDFLTLMR